MIYLGNHLAEGLKHVVNRASITLRDEGEIALFIGVNGECAAYAHYHELYDRHIRVHAHELVGVYRNDDACHGVARSLYNQLEEDVKYHVECLGQRSAA